MPRKRSSKRSTSTHTEMPTTLFVFAHQDDEVGAAPWIVEEVSLGKRVLCVYLTDGGSRTDPAVRDAESRSALVSLGVPTENVAFLSDGERIGDNQLVSNLPRAWRLLDGWIDENAQAVERIYSLAWEGGHPDHDAAHVLALLAAERRGITDAWQFSLYNAYKRPRPFFRVLSHVPAMAAKRKLRSTLARRVGYAIFCWRFTSQRRTWLGLFPELFVRRILWRDEMVIRFDRKRIMQRPHPGELLFERMFGMRYEVFESGVRVLLDQCCRSAGTP